MKIESDTFTILNFPTKEEYINHCNYKEVFQFIEDKEPLVFENYDYELQIESENDGEYSFTPSTRYSYHDLIRLTFDFLDILEHLDELPKKELIDPELILDERGEIIGQKPLFESDKYRVIFIGETPHDSYTDDWEAARLLFLLKNEEKEEPLLHIDLAQDFEMDLVTPLMKKVLEIL